MMEDRELEGLFSLMVQNKAQQEKARATNQKEAGYAEDTPRLYREERQRRFIKQLLDDQVYWR